MYIIILSLCPFKISNRLKLILFFLILFLQGQYEDRIEFETNVSFYEPDLVSVLRYDNCIVEIAQQYQYIIQLTRALYI